MMSNNSDQLEPSPLTRGGAILLFGGTTEGRKAAEVLEEAGKTYYYSTRSDGQQIELVHGIRLTGGMDVAQMVACCRKYNIRLMVDAAHPFAEELHRNLLVVARHIQAPIIRYDRIYPPRDEELVWCKDYDEAVRRLEAEGITRLLALTGVNTIGKLRTYWERHEACWFRILNRRASQHVARANRFPEERLVYYETDDTLTLIRNLRPQAILTKESGLSGGFTEKVEAARQAGVRVFVVERPAYPPHTSDPQPVLIEEVNGPFGLRRAVERLLPEFYDLHSGLTTGTCATAAAVAAALRLLKNETPGKVPVVLPNGETIKVPVGYGEDYAYCVKEAGDDPDVTNGVEVRAMVRCASDSPSIEILDGAGDSLSVEILGGEGVGRFTLPGFDYPVGEAAINKGPREMIKTNLSILNSQFSTKVSQLSTLNPQLSPLTVTISVPNGSEIARRTFNPRLGIEGGISIIGVSGIVKPFSEEAFIDSIRKCMQVAVASGADRVVINSGGKSERFVRALYPDLPRQVFVEYGNYIGETLTMAAELGIGKVTLGVMLGKAVKLAAGNLDTHSRKVVMDKPFLQSMLNEAGIVVDLEPMTLARELWTMVPAHQLQTMADVIISHCHRYCKPLVPNGELTILLISDEGSIYSLSTRTESD